MNEFKRAIEQVIWQTLEKHYNIDRSEPRVLTYKHIMMQDPVGDLATRLTDITEELIKEAINQISNPPPEAPADSDGTDDEDDDIFDPYGSYYGGD